MFFSHLLATADPVAVPVAWHADSFGMAVIATLVFGMIGIVLAIFGFKLFDWLTPGNLQQEIVEKQNIAAAILGGAIIIGICIVVAAAVG